MKTRKAGIKVKKIQGYSVVCVPVASPICMVRAIVHSGFIYETQENLGVFHLLEHVLVNAWERCNKNCILYWEKQGCVLNANTQETTMHYFVKGLPDMLEDMIAYIASITTNAVLYDSVIETEKKAVYSELINEQSSPQNSLDNVFNQSFYTTEGLRFISDARVQLKRLASFTKKDLYDMYRKVFTPANVLFVVYGQVAHDKVHRCFSKHLVYRPPVELPSLPCFSFKQQFLYTPSKHANINMKMGFPLSRILPCQELFPILMKNILFLELRSKHNLIYSVDCSVMTNHCNSVFLIEMDCVPANFKRIVEHIVSTIEYYQTHKLSKDLLNGSKRKLLYNYHTLYEYDIYYASYLYDKQSLLTKSQLIKQNAAFSEQHFYNIMNKDILLEHCTLAYQGPTDLKLTWKSFM